MFFSLLATLSFAFKVHRVSAKSYFWGNRMHLRFYLIHRSIVSRSKPHHVNFITPDNPCLLISLARLRISSVSRFALWKFLECACILLLRVNLRESIWFTILRDALYTQFFVCCLLFARCIFLRQSEVQFFLTFPTARLLVYVAFVTIWNIRWSTCERCKY